MLLVEGVPIPTPVAISIQPVSVPFDLLLFWQRGRRRAGGGRGRQGLAGVSKGREVPPSAALCWCPTQ